jgi:AcrR family transcriptional regulator
VALLSAAEETFAESGYEAATMCAIASRACASIGSLYQFFPNKEAIATALLRRHMEALAATLDDWKGQLPKSPRQFAGGLIALTLEYLDRRPACAVLSDAPSLAAFKPEALGVLSAKVQELLSILAPGKTDYELMPAAQATWLIVRNAVQASRALDTNGAERIISELRFALGAYLEERLAG